MNEKYYYFARLNELKNIAENGITAGENYIYRGEEGILEYKNNIVNDGSSVFKKNDECIAEVMCLSVYPENIEKDMENPVVKISEEIKPEKIRVVTVKNLVSDKVSNYWIDLANKIELEKQSKVTPLLVEETDIADYIKEHNPLEIISFSQGLALEKRKSDNFFSRMINRVRKIFFDRKQVESKKMRKERLINMAKNVLENKESGV